MPVSASHTGDVDVRPPPPEPVLWPEATGENPFARKEPPDPLLLIPDWAGPEPWREVEASLLEDALVMEDGETWRQTSGPARGTGSQGRAANVRIDSKPRPAGAGRQTSGQVRRPGTPGPGGKRPNRQRASTAGPGRQTSGQAGGPEPQGRAANVRIDRGQRRPGQVLGSPTAFGGGYPIWKDDRIIAVLEDEKEASGLGRAARAEPHEQSRLTVRGGSAPRARSRDFSSDQGAEPEEYREYAEVWQRRGWRKRSGLDAV